MAKSNIQPFRRHDEFADGMMEVVTDVANLQLTQLWNLKDQWATSRDFGKFLWDNKLFDLAAFFSRSYWADNYPAILKAMSIAGTYEAYIIVVNSAMGDGRITFGTPNPGHLVITISAGDTVRPFDALLSDGSLSAVSAGGSTYDGEHLDFIDSTSNLTFQETVKLIELLNVNGIFVEVVAS